MTFLEVLQQKDRIQIRGTIIRTKCANDHPYRLTRMICMHYDCKTIKPTVIGESTRRNLLPTPRSGCRNLINCRALSRFCKHEVGQRFSRTKVDHTSNQSGYTDIHMNKIVSSKSYHAKCISCTVIWE